MPKKKKTRKEKILSDQRRQTHQAAGTSPSVTSTPRGMNDLLTSDQPNTTVAFATPKSTSTAQHAISTIDYKYLPGDLMKTAILTGSIIVIELVIKFIFRI